MELHADQFGQQHFPGIEPPSEAQPVHFDIERSQANAREARKRTNFQWPGRDAAIRYTGGRNRPQMASWVPSPRERVSSTASDSVVGPHEHAVWQAAGRVEMVPTTNLTAPQRAVNPRRVVELVKHPERGSSVRFPAGHELPYGLRTADNEVQVRNGNHRIHKEKALGQMFHPMRVIDVRDPAQRQIVDDTRNRLAYAHAMASAKHAFRMEEAQRTPGMTLPGEVNKALRRLRDREAAQ